MSASKDEVILDDTQQVSFTIKKSDFKDEPLDTDATHLLAQVPVSIEPATAQIHSSSLEKITEAQQNLNNVNEKLNKIIDSTELNKSLLTQASDYVGQRPIYEQVIGGVIIVVPTLATGVALQLGALYTVSVLSGLAYSASVALLNENFKCNVNNKEALKEVVKAIVGVLETTIQKLEVIREKFAEELEKFKAENQKLIESVTKLADQIVCLSHEIMALSTTQKKLTQTTTDLETSNKKLEEKIDQQIEASENNRREIEETKQLCIVVKNELDKKTVEYNTAKIQLEQDLEKARGLGASLTGMVTMLSGVAFETGKEKEEFRTKLDQFMLKQDENTTKVLDKLTLTEQKVDKVSTELSNLMEGNTIITARLDTLITTKQTQDERIANVASLDFTDEEHVKALNEHGLSALSMFKPVKAGKPSESAQATSQATLVL